MRLLKQSTALPAGKPRGAQSLYNKAMWHLFHCDDSQPDSEAKVLLIGEPQTEEDKAAVKLRQLMSLQAINRERLAVKVCWC